MSQAASSLVLVVILFAMAVYLGFSPPEGFHRVIDRLVLPVLLFAGAMNILENMRTRAHIGQLVGALKSLVGKGGPGKTPTPEVKAEAVEILIGSLRSDKKTVRETALAQLRHLTGQDLGDDTEAWERWWAANKESFRRGA